MFSISNPGPAFGPLDLSQQIRAQSGPSEPSIGTDRAPAQQTEPATPAPRSAAGEPPVITPVPRPLAVAAAIAARSTPPSLPDEKQAGADQTPDRPDAAQSLQGGLTAQTPASPQGERMDIRVPMPADQRASTRFT